MTKCLKVSSIVRSVPLDKGNLEYAIILRYCFCYIPASIKFKENNKLLTRMWLNTRLSHILVEAAGSYSQET